MCSSTFKIFYTFINFNIFIFSIFPHLSIFPYAAFSPILFIRSLLVLNKIQFPVEKQKYMKSSALTLKVCNLQLAIHKSQWPDERKPAFTNSKWRERQKLHNLRLLASTNFRCNIPGTLAALAYRPRSVKLWFENAFVLRKRGKIFRN